MQAPTLSACPLCGLLQNVPHVELDQVARCPRCAGVVLDPRSHRRNRSRVAAAAVAGLLLYPLAIFLPVMTVERFGYKSEASIWGGSFGLLRDGELLVGGIVLVFSVLVPLAKLSGMLWVSWKAAHGSHRDRAVLYRWIDLLGRWGMLDVLLLAVLVAWVKVGVLVDIRPGPGALAFTLCVGASLLASAWFDPHAAWEPGPRRRAA